MKIVGSAIGDPYSASTYSGVPYQIFRHLSESGLLVGRTNGFRLRPVDYFCGYVDIQKSILFRKLYRNALWRFRKSSIVAMSKRLSSQLARTEYDVFLQIGCGGLPNSGCFKVSHIEIPIHLALSDEEYSRSYGFYGFSKSKVEEALAGEKYYMDQCDLIWTNTEWTANAIVKAGVPREKIFVYPPCINLDPNRKFTSKNFDNPHLLFIGKDWERKGGPSLVAAYKMILDSNPHATLDIIGCSPSLEPVKGLSVHGFLDKRKPQDFEKFSAILAKSNIFCMPSSWESTGIVYFEAMERSLPVIMVEGQGREELFKDIAHIMPDNEPATIANTIEALMSNKEQSLKKAILAYVTVE